MTSSARDSDTTLTVASSLGDVSAKDWNALVGQNDPFLEYDFLRAMETSGAVGEGTGWMPRYVVLVRGGRLIGAVPFYVKWDSYGEYIFDWAWADAYHRAGISYYPKMLVAAPFTPVTGSRILVHPDEAFEPCARPMLGALLDFARDAGCSGLHVLFLEEHERDLLVELGFLERVTYQFHWHNRGYASFDEFLGDLRSSKRKDVRKERREVAGHGLDIRVLEGAEIEAEHIEALWRFYRDTTGRKWGEAYLNRSTFELIGEQCRRNLVLVMAARGDRWVAGTLNFRKGRRLYGRYWGASEYYRGLHFECCYYRLIEYAIAAGLERFEASAQGEHKFLRGFETRPTYSCHWLEHPAGRDAVARFLEAERPQVHETIRRYNRLSPLKHLRCPGA